MLRKDTLFHISEREMSKDYYYYYTIPPKNLAGIKEK